jgi:hypothetical protein
MRQQIQNYTVDLMRYRYQNQENQYTEIMVEGLQLRYNIYGNKGVTANVGSSKLLIPLDYNIARTLRYDRKERLYLRSLHFVMNSRFTKSVKWYETSIFRFVLVVVAVAITIFTAGASSPIATAMASSAYATVAILVIKQLVINYIVSYAITKGLEVVAAELGIDVTNILAVMAFVAAAYGVAVEAEWVNYAIAAGSGLSSAAQVEVQKKLAAYQTESQEFDLLAEEKYAELEEVNNLLNSYDLLDPRSFIGRVPSIILGEEPDAMYNRTIHSGNIGTSAFDYIESYVDINLQLPTFNDLVGDTFYGRT